MTRETRKTNIRWTPAEQRRVAAAARQAEVSVNQYVITAALERAENRQVAEQVTAALDDRMETLTQALAGALTALAEQHAAADAELRTAIKSGLGKVVEIVKNGGRP